ncbi:16075_t:CDS:1 [Acaulospora colombiana]|uniref:16075_t:CDS:1 n=1 Tax=Acaulospora colombiana TaxID=27376 RepID=A0ACA9KDA5_9GLOM|nr:16075_t:CDS:1 [Acaulospora colombiana]
MDCVEFESEEIQVAITETLSTACSHKNCRALVTMHCQKYLANLMTSKNQKLKTTAAVALTKIKLDEEKSPGDEKQDVNSKIRVIDEDEALLSDLFERAVLNDEVDVEVRVSAIEGLAYSSLKPTVKEVITYHPTLFKEIFNLIQEEKTNNALCYGVAVMLSNITTYRRRLSETEEQYLKLKKLAGEASNLEPDPVDDDEYVINRGKQVMKLGVVRALTTMSKCSSEMIRQIVAKIFLNLSTDQNNRGAIVQQGGIKVLIPLATKGPKETTAYATQALAKIAITMDPSLAFRGERATDLVRPFLALCQGESELCQFEALMALTNLESVDDDIRMRIYDAKGIPIIEGLQFSDNVMIRRASTECLCNMMFCEPVYEMYSEIGESAANRIKILVALSDVEDFETRRASSGALAILSTSPNVCKMIAERPRGIDLLKDLISEQSIEIQHRCVEIIKNMTKVDKKMVETLVRAKVHEKLAEFIKECKVEPVVEIAVEALREISKYSSSNRE